MNGAKSDLNLSQCDGLRVAMIWHLPHGRRVFRGKARYVRGSDGENALWIKPDDLGAEDGNPEFVIHEPEWTGEIVPDQGHDCDVQIEIRALPTRS
jgi:hypothetical protein